MNLTGLAFLLAGAIALLGIAGLWYGGELSGAWRFPTVLFLLAFIAEGGLARRHKFAMRRSHEAQVALGQPFSMDLSISNMEERVLIIEAQPGCPKGMIGLDHPIRSVIAPGEKHHQKFAAFPKVLGNFAWPPIYTRVLGYFGLAWWPRKVTLPGGGRVAPSQLSSQERASGVIVGGQIAMRPRGAGLELISLRDYRAGDPLRAIDWKASARSGRPTVRVFSEDQQLELILAIDAGRSSNLEAGPLTRVQHYINIAARLAEKAIHNGDRVGIVVFADKPQEIITPVKGIAGLMQIRGVLERIRVTSQESNPLAAMLEIRRLVKHRTLVPLFTDLDEGERADQLTKATKLIAPQHLPLIAALIDEEVEAMREKPAERWLDPYETLAAEILMQEAHSVMMQLVRLGAAVVFERPNALDSAVLAYYEKLRQRRQI